MNKPARNIFRSFFNGIFHTTIKRVKFLDQKLLKSIIIYCSEAQWYLVCTEVVHHIRAVLFWIIYYGSALSQPSYYDNLYSHKSSVEWNRDRQTESKMNNKPKLYKHKKHTKHKL